MDGVNLKLDGSAMHELVQGAILRALGKEGRDQLIKDAVSYLTKEEALPYGRGKKPSILSVAFEETLKKVAREIIAERLKSDAAFNAAVNSVYEGALAEWNEKHRPQLVRKVIDKLESTITRGW